MAELANALRPPLRAPQVKLSKGTSYFNEGSNNLRERILRELVSTDQSDNDDGFIQQVAKKNPTSGKYYLQ